MVEKGSVNRVLSVTQMKLLYYNAVRKREKKNSLKFTSIKKI